MRNNCDHDFCDPNVKGAHVFLITNNYNGENAILAGEENKNGLSTSGGGYREKGECCIQTCLRELKEESGFDFNEECFISNRTGKYRYFITTNKKGSSTLFLIGHLPHNFSSKSINNILDERKKNKNRYRKEELEMNKYIWIYYEKTEKKIYQYHRENKFVYKEEYKGKIRNILKDTIKKVWKYL